MEVWAPSSYPKHRIPVGKRDQRGFVYYTHAKIENDRAFSKRVHALVDYLSSKWADKAHPILLKLALHTEMPHDAFEGRQILSDSGSMITDKSGDDYYEATLMPDIPLPTATCISKLSYNKYFQIPRSFGTRYPNFPSDRNVVSISAICDISSACGGQHSQKVTLYCECENPGFTPAIDADHRMAVANALQRLPAQVQETDFRHDNPGWSESLVDDPPTIRLLPDILSSALHRISMQLRHLKTEGMCISPEIFWPLNSPETTEAPWPHLENLDLKFDPFTPTDEFLKYGYSVYELHYRDSQFLISYLDRVYESAGRAAQHMTRIRNFTFAFQPESYDLQVKIRNGKRVLEITTDDDCGGALVHRKPYKPTTQVLDAWNVSGGKMSFDSEMGRTEVEYED